jgi:hypothetical protein
MPSESSFELLHGGGDLPDVPGRLGLAVEVLRARVIEEFQITERLDAKGRQVFALAAAFFAVAQTVAFAAFRASALNSAERAVIVALAACAAVALLLTGTKLADAEEPQPEQDIAPAKIEEWARDEDDQRFGELLVAHLREIADARHASNQTRAVRYAEIETRARVALIITAVEILAAIALRI